ncbi:MAG: thioredoxin domain-containing protein, partial [Haloarculaceae archaeon]
TDRDWTVPHFEKMLYDNAELPRAFLAGYQVTGADRYAEVVRETFSFVEREMTHPGGGFYSTLDAQSRPPDDPDAAPEEGLFYVWTPEGVHEAVDDETDADLFCARYGVDETGNFEDRTTVLTVAASLDDLADSFDLAPDAVADRLDTARAQVFAARQERPRPRRDEKVIAGWNGLQISALAEGALVLDPDYAAQAADALAFVRDRLWDETTGRLSRRFVDVPGSRDGDVEGTGYLEDYAFLGRGAFDLYQATGEVEHLAFALDLARTLVAEFWDESAETLYFTPASGEDLVARPQELTDQSTPSSTGVAVQLLQSLAHFTDDDEFATVAERTLATHASRLASNPLQHASLALAADAHETGPLELTVVADALPGRWRERIGATYLPTRLLSVRPPGDLDRWLDALDLDAAPPIWADRDQVDGEPTVYACRSFTCSPPQTDVDAALSWADDLADGR